MPYNLVYKASSSNRVANLSNIFHPETHYLFACKNRNALCRPFPRCCAAVRFSEQARRCPLSSPQIRRYTAPLHRPFAGVRTAVFLPACSAGIPLPTPTYAVCIFRAKIQGRVLCNDKEYTLTVSLSIGIP